MTTTQETIRPRVVLALLRRDLARLEQVDAREIARNIEEDRRYLLDVLREIEGGAAWTR